MDPEQATNGGAQEELKAAMNESLRRHLRELDGRAQLLAAKLYHHEAEEREIMVAAAIEGTGVGG